MELLIGMLLQMEIYHHLNKSNVDDLGFFNAMLDEINQDNLIDLNRGLCNRIF